MESIVITAWIMANSSGGFPIWISHRLHQPSSRFAEKKSIVDDFKATKEQGITIELDNFIILCGLELEKR